MDLTTTCDQLILTLSILIQIQLCKLVLPANSSINYRHMKYKIHQLKLVASLRSGAYRRPTKLCCISIAVPVNFLVQPHQEADTVSRFDMPRGMRRSAATSKRKAISRSRLVKTPLQHVVVLRKLRRLKKLVPGCCRSTAIGLEELLRRTAQYISFLELKVILLKRTIDFMGINKLK
ncbi:hypothetical protein ZIOFF_054436 [Zingiber officinale]|uniref:BHLH domain-containing protein n=1 Tax=Zingiber officinale TaxID=94328 RepID=A0A8J5KPA5_ZINOF|nr:hypothetical protein ZIOFF_054436 [Zingiber officinale]